MRIAVIGAGFCGLATAWHLSQHKDNEVVLFDAKGIGKGASGVAAGLLHGYVGAHAKLNWHAVEAMQATKELLAVAEKALGMPVAEAQGMLRPALTPLQVSDFQLSASAYADDVHWRTAAECQARMPLLVPNPGIFIDSGMVVDCPAYLQGLWLACAARGVSLELASITSLQDLDGYDRIAVAIGAATLTLPELAHLPLRLIKGQVLELAWSESMPPLPFPVNSLAYLLMNPNGGSCMAGATYERNFTSSAPDQAFAAQDILPKINAFTTGLDDAAIIDCRSGVRAMSTHRKPILTKVLDNCWVLTGMGSKGLLYHALYAKELAAQIIA